MHGAGRPAAASVTTRARGRHPIAECRAAISMLTRIPIRGVPGDTTGAAAFGVVGAVIGAARRACRSRCWAGRAGPCGDRGRGRARDRVRRRSISTASRTPPTRCSPRIRRAPRPPARTRRPGSAARSPSCWCSAPRSRRWPRLAAGPRAGVRGCWPASRPRRLAAPSRRRWPAVLATRPGRPRRAGGVVRAHVGRADAVVAVVSAAVIVAGLAGIAAVILPVCRHRARGRRGRGAAVGSLPPARSSRRAASLDGDGIGASIELDAGRGRPRCRGRPLARRLMAAAADPGARRHPQRQEPVRAAPRPGGWPARGRAWFLATAWPGDPEMDDRIARHRRERPATGRRIDVGVRPGGGHRGDRSGRARPDRRADALAERDPGR